MSRIGKLPIAIPGGVTVNVAANNLVTVKGPKGELTQAIDPDIMVKVEEGFINLERPTEQKRHKALHGLSRSLLFNNVKGVSEGFEIKQELVGVGYKATHKGQLLDLAIGYSHEIMIELPKEITLNTITEKGQNPLIILNGCDKQLIGQVAAKIRSLRKPEPYKGKGIRFQGEVIRRKAGKTAGK
ncbi:MAG: 50S ribosomal protein L6 [Bacteroidetes bacterium]|nr:50S ribosomal protein L6 [Bacteroidota bacterium]